MRNRLALAAALPLVAVLAACSTAGGPAAPAPTTASPAGSTGSSTGSSPSSTVQGVTSRPTNSTSGGGTHTRPAPPAPRPTVQDALDTVRSYMTREIGMHEPRLSRFRWTGTDTAAVDVRSAAGGESIPGPVTTVSMRRLRTVWLVTGARAEGIRVDMGALTAGNPWAVRVAGRVVDGGSWRVTLTQDRYGKDPVLARQVLLPLRPGAPGAFDQVLGYDRPTARTGSVLLTEDFPGGGLGVMRATVIRIGFAPAPTSPACSSAALLPVMRSWFDDPSLDGRVAKVHVLRCRNGYAHVVATFRKRPGPNELDGLQAYIRYQHRRWEGVDFGTGLECTDASIQQACKALGYTK